MQLAAGALLLDKVPTATPQEVYDAIQNSASTSGTGTVPNDTWGYGKFDVLAASQRSPFPVELSSFTAKVLRAEELNLTGELKQKLIIMDLRLKEVKSQLTKVKQNGRRLDL